MTQEKALILYARGYNSRDFSGICSKLHKKADFEAYNRFYRHSGKASVERYFEERAADLLAQTRLNRAYLGFIMVKRGLLGIKCEPCVVLTKDDPPRAEGVVRITCTPLHVREIRILDPAGCDFTRGDYAG